MLAPTVMVGTDSGPVPIVVPKVTKRAREDFAIAFDSVQKTDVFAENIDALKDKLLKKLQNKEKVLEEEIYARILRVTDGPGARHTRGPYKDVVPTAQNKETCR